MKDDLDRVIEKAVNLGREDILDNWENWILDCMRRDKDYIPFHIMLKTIKEWRKKEWNR